MNILDILFLSVALAMDCFTVSIVSGVILRRHVWSVIIRIAVLFGVFQAIMPLIGWLATTSFAKYIEEYDHWIAFSLLAFLGGKMIYESFKPEEEQSFNPRHLKTQLALSVATSIDALSIGISFACTGYSSLRSLVFPLVSIGVVSFAFSVAGHMLGIKFGNRIIRLLKPEILGGLILIFIGVKILLSHLFGL